MIHDIDINFDSREFGTKAKMLGIKYYKTFVKAYWLVRKVEKYYIPICYTYNIICAKKQGIIFNNAIL